MRNTSLRIKFTLYVAATIALLTLPILLNDYFQRMALLNANFEQNQATTLDSLTFDAREALETGLFEHFNHRISHFVARSDIYTIELRNDERKTVGFAPELTFYHGAIATRKIYSRADGELFDHVNQSASIADGKYLGTLLVYFNDTPQQAQVTRLILETILLLLGICIIAVVCMVLADRYLTRRITQMAKALVGIQKGDYHPNLSSSNSDELGQLAQLINETGSALEQFERDKTRERDKKIADHTSRIEKEIRNFSLIQNLVGDVKDSIEKTFSQAVKFTDKDNSDKAHQLITGMVDSIRSVDEIQLILEKDELPSHRRYTAERVSHYGASIEKGISTLASRKEFPIRLIIDKEIYSSDRYVLVDVNATMRLLALALEYWPLSLNTEENPWQITVSVQHHFERSPTIRLELSAEVNHLDREAWQDIQSSILTSSEEEQEPLKKMLTKLTQSYQVQQAIQFDDCKQVIVSYEFEYISGLSPKEVFAQVKEKLGGRKKVFLVGSDEFISSVGYQLEALFIDYSCATYEELANDASITHKHNDAQLFGLVLVDCVSDFTLAKQIMNDFNRANPQLRTLKVGLVDQYYYENTLIRGVNLHADLDADDIMTLPISPSDIIRLVSGLSSDEVVNDFIRTLQKQEERGS